jgi:hypothetical protein
MGQRRTQQKDIGKQDGKSKKKEKEKKTRSCGHGSLAKKQMRLEIIEVYMLR